MIRIGTNPEGIPGINKFLGKRREGHRGVIIARRLDGKQAIILSMTESSVPEDGVRWGHFYLVEETNHEHYPRVVRQVHAVPDRTDWKIVLTERLEE